VFGGDDARGRAPRADDDGLGGEAMKHSEAADELIWATLDAYSIATLLDGLKPGTWRLSDHELELMREQAWALVDLLQMLAEKLPASRLAERGFALPSAAHPPVADLPKAG
jgi:hypothetical protein